MEPTHYELIVTSIITIFPSWKRHRVRAAERNWGGRKKNLQLSDTSHYAPGTFFCMIFLLSHKNLFLYSNTGILEDNQVWLLHFVYFREKSLSSMEQIGFEIPTPNPTQHHLLPPNGPCLFFLRTIPLNQIFSKTKPPLIFSQHTQIFQMKYFKNNQSYLQTRNF